MIDVILITIQVNLINYSKSHRDWHKLLVSILMAFFFVCLFLLLCTHLLQDLAGSEGINPSSLNRGFLGCRSAIAAANIVAIITLAIIIVFKTTKLGDSTERSTTDDEFNNGSTFRDEVYGCIPMSEFAAATQNFSDCNILHKGVYTVYRGAHISTSKVPFQSDNCLSVTQYDTLHLSHGSHLTYKPPSSIIYKGVYLPNDRDKFGHIFHLSHPNLAHMLGYSCSNRETVVGYKIEGARLLFHQLRNYNISWLDRLNICIGVAEALRCLHTARIIHGGISPTTIFLDNSSSPKLVTFGSVLSHLSNDKQTEETDVYLFGLLLLIVFCGKETDYSNRYPFRLPNKVSKAVKDKTLHEITNLSLAQVGNESLYEFLVVAFHCINPTQVVQPNMDGVVEGLKKARALYMPGWLIT